MVVERRYWDSDCSLGWLRSEPDKVKECQEVLQVAEDGQVMIVTSALTIAEVLNLEGRGSTFTIPPENAAAVIAFFRNPYIVVRNITRKVSEQAREFVWTHRVMPKDALHEIGRAHV